MLFALAVIAINRRGLRAAHKGAIDEKDSRHHLEGHPGSLFSTSELLFFLILPVFFTFLLAGGTGPPSDARIRLVVVDQAKTSLSAELIDTLDQSEAVVPGSDALGPGRGSVLTPGGQVSALLVIPPPV